MNKHTQPGFILVLTLMILALAIVITTQLFNQGSIHSVFAKTVVEREKAKQIALGGVSVAMSLLTVKPQADKAKEGGAVDEDQALLKKILPGINRWVAFNLQEDTEGIDGQLRICISCEQGKIDINKIYDFNKKKFVGEDQPKGDMKKIMQSLFKSMKDWTDKDLFPAFENFLKTRGMPLYDVTDLLAIKEFNVFKDVLFYAPPVAAKGEKQTKRPVYLMDIFTIDSNKLTIQPWLLSDSLCALLNLRRAQDNELKKRTEEVGGLLKVFKKENQWATQWNTILKPIYDKDFTSLPKDIDSLLAPQFESHTFSVLTYGKVGEIEQRLYTILERQVQQQKGSNPHFVVKKIYWI